MRRSFLQGSHGHWRVCCSASTCIVERHGLTSGIERRSCELFLLGATFARCGVWVRVPALLDPRFAGGFWLVQRREPSLFRKDLRCCGCLCYYSLFDIIMLFSEALHPAVRTAASIVSPEADRTRGCADLQGAGFLRLGWVALRSAASIVSPEADRTRGCAEGRSSWLPCVCSVCVCSKKCEC